MRNQPTMVFRPVMVHLSSFHPNRPATFPPAAWGPLLRIATEMLRKERCFLTAEAVQQGSRLPKRSSFFQCKIQEIEENTMEKP